MNNTAYDFLKFLKINSKLILVVSSGDYEGYYDSRVEDIDEEGNIIVAAPTSSGVPVPLTPSTKLSASFMGPESRYFFSTSVLGKISEKNIFFLKLKKPENIEEKQLRNFFRVPVWIKSRIFLLGPPKEDDTEDVPYADFECIIMDLSGGGCMVSSEANAMKGQRVSVDLSSVVGLPTVYHGVVIRSSRVDNRRHISIEFDIDKDSERTKIIKYVFRRQIELKQMQG